MTASATPENYTTLTDVTLLERPGDQLAIIGTETSALENIARYFPLAEAKRGWFDQSAIAGGAHSACCVSPWKTRSTGGEARW